MTFSGKSKNFLGLANTKNILHRKTHYYHYCRYNQRQICTQYLERQKPNQKNINKNKIKLYSSFVGEGAIFKYARR